jgi:ethanolamine ammonia-lyase small subunit
MKPITQADPWQQLKIFTRARIAQGRVGSSLPTQEILEFGMAHAMARDAVHLPLNTVGVQAEIQSLGFETLIVHSKAESRATYLLRPDLGRRLNDESKQHLLTYLPKKPIDLLIVVGDGLSALAVHHNAATLLSELIKRIPPSLKVGPIVIAQQARVALADEVAEIVSARMVVMLIGERPGLTSPDSLGAYLTFSPTTACNDANRNCISNIRSEGLQLAPAADKLNWLIMESFRRKISGVALKDESDSVEISLCP